ncbi:MAG: transcriptional regulator [Planctomycetes bacterium]|nr:transcriptional regulator [Planctomycetota bacterium]
MVIQVHPETDISLLELQASFCRVMGHPHRILILHLLHDAGGELPSADILRRLGISKASLSQHISRMVAVGLLTTRREGRFLHVKLACPEVGDACTSVREVLSRQAEERASSFACDQRM